MEGILYHPILQEYIVLLYTNIMQHNIYKIEKSELERLYTHEHLSTITISKILGCSQGKIWTMLKKYGIPLRNKGCTYKNLPYIIESIKSDTNNCIEWPYYRTKKGYGRIRYNNKDTFTHVVSYIISHGPLKFAYVCHSCNNPPCFNPKHLYNADHETNARDAARDGLYPRGSSHWNAKLSEDDVRKMRNLNFEFGYNPYRLGKIFGVSCSTAQGIVLRKIWKHII